MRACPHMPKVLKHLVASDLMFLYMCQAPLQMHPLPTLGGSSFKQAQSRKAYHKEAFILRRYSITDGHKAAALLFPVRRKTKTLMARNALEPTGPTAPSEVYQERLQPLPVQRHTTKGFAVAPACKSRTQYKRGCLLVQAPNIASVAPFTGQDTSLSFSCNSFGDVLVELLRSAFLPAALHPFLRLPTHGPQCLFHITFSLSLFQCA